MSLDIYTQMDDESPRAFEAFAIYRDMGPARHLDAVATKVDKNLSLIRRWSSDYSWVTRARAWDAENDRVKRDAQTKVVQEMSERHAKIAVGFQNKVIQRLQNLDPDELSARELAQWLDISVKIERLSRGANTELVRNEITGLDGEPILIEKPRDAKEMAEIINTLIEAGALDQRIDQSDAASVTG